MLRLMEEETPILIALTLLLIIALKVTVLRSPAPKSRRNLAVVLSPEGEKPLKQAQKPAERAYERLMTPLSAE